MAQNVNFVKCFYVYEFVDKKRVPSARKLKKAVYSTVSIPCGIPYYRHKEGNVDRSRQWFADEQNINEPMIAEWTEFTMKGRTWTYFTCIPVGEYEHINRALVLAGFIKSDVPF